MTEEWSPKAATARAHEALNSGKGDCNILAKDIIALDAALFIMMEGLDSVKNGWAKQLSKLTTQMNKQGIMNAAQWNYTGKDGKKYCVILQRLEGKTPLEHLGDMLNKFRDKVKTAPEETFQELIDIGLINEDGSLAGSHTYRKQIEKSK